MTQAIGKFVTMSWLSLVSDLSRAKTDTASLKSTGILLVLVGTAFILTDLLVSSKRKV